MTAIHIFPAINTILLLVVLGLVMWRNRIADLGNLWDEVHALKLRVDVVERSTPCLHCQHHHRGPNDGDGC